MLSLRDVSVRAGTALLVDAVSFEVAAHEWVCIVGPNGAGKSTLLSAIAKLMPHSGTVHVEATPLSGLSRREVARRVALVPQLPIVPPGMRVRDYVLLGRTAHCDVLGRHTKHDHAEVDAALAALDIESFSQRAVDSLSGGERQRVVCARALAQAAPLLLLDEPTTSLDLGHQQDLIDLLDSLRRAKPIAILSTLHDLTLAGHAADRVLLLSAGRVAAIGPPTDVLTASNIAEHYGARVQVLHDGGHVTVIPTR